MKEPLVSLVKMLLNKNSIKINTEELDFQLRSHPTYPSLHSVTGVLDHFSVKNYALEVPKNKETLQLLPNHFLALIKDDKHNGFVLASKIAQSIHLSYNDNKKKIVTENEFIDFWSGIIVIIESDIKEIGPPTKKHRFTNRNTLITTLALISIYFIYQNTTFSIIHFLLSLTGLAVCILILYHDLGIKSKALDKFCTEGNKKINCNDVLSSKGANLFGYLKLSNAGIIYFVFQIVSSVILKNSSNSYSPLIIISLLAIPFTFFSVYYQFKIVKKLCPLCLTVVSILWLQAIAIFFSNYNELSLSVNAILTTFFCFIFSFALWQFISPLFKKEQELKALRIKHFKFKRSFNIFQALLNSNNRKDTQTRIPNEIIFRNTKEKAILEIIVITNPLCGFCKEAHLLVEKIIPLNDKSINTIIRFNVNDDPNSLDSKISLRLLEIYNLDGDEACLAAMHDIYSNTTPNKWLVKWGEPSKPEYKTTLTQEKEWCKQQSINFTPEILVNGRSFPKEYDKVDLLGFVDEMIEEETETANTRTHELDLVSQNN
ncbi:MAG: hypothetical protein EHM93_06320 [Bacteroidales bacterium]|nr:MAG: hypothetical protein EHM93_06320 [Bacteroidales bacterium]